MAGNVRVVEVYGENLKLLFDDGSSSLAFPTTNSFWIPMGDTVAIEKYADQLLITLPGGSKLLAFPTPSGRMWIPNNSLILVTPAAPTQSGNIVTIPSITGVQYSINGANVSSGTHIILDNTTINVTAVPVAGYRFPAGSYSWSFTYTPPVTSGFKYPFPRTLHTSYTGHSGTDWPGNSVGNSARIPVIGAGTVSAVYDTNYNTTGMGNAGANEPIWRGICVVVNHGVIDGNTIYSLYAHLSSRAVNVGDTVSAGQGIGVIGNTGYSSGTHLHFEVNINGNRRPTNSVPSGYTVTMDWMDSHTDGSNW